MTSVRTPAMAFETADPDFARSPWDRYEAIREAGGIVYNETVNRWMVTGFRTVTRILAETDRFGSEKGQLEQAALFGGPTMEFDDGEHHDRVRAIWARDFQRGTLAGLRPMITGIVRARLRPFVTRIRDGETVDAVADLTRVIPTEVIARMLGVDAEMVDAFTGWSDAIGASAEGFTSRGERGARLRAAGAQATAELNAYLEGQLDARRCPGSVATDLVSTMVNDDYACAHMSRTEIVASNTQLVFAGNETTAKLMALTLTALAQNPEQRSAVARDRSLVPQTIEEVHRHQTVSHSIFRDVVGADAEVDGVVVPEGERLTLLLGAANRDPARWDRPAVFDVHRTYRQHLGFAFGMHSCLGMNLARLEAQILLEEVLDVLPGWQLAGDIDFGTNYAIRGPLVVPLAIG